MNPVYKGPEADFHEWLCPFCDSKDLQRGAIWTTLVGPATALILGVFGSAYYLVFYLVIALFVRCCYLLILALEGHRVVLRDAAAVRVRREVPWRHAFADARVDIRAFVDQESYDLRVTQPHRHH